MFNNLGEEIAPWGTPASIDISEPIFVTKKQLSRYDLKIKNKIKGESFLTYMRQSVKLCLLINRYSK